ncbi:DUF2490 domain-containing protein [Tamlana fucoidanivorans]
MNIALRSRYILYSDFDVQYLQQQVDFLHFSSLKLSYNHRLSLGFLYRNRDWFQRGSDEFRLTEQFNYTKQKLGVRYGHRIRFEQRFFKTSTVYRQRYRFAVDFPLNGEKLDIGETYLISAVESLLSLSDLYQPETDLRLTAQIGWQLSQALKLQTGLEHRLEAFNLETFNTLFVLTSAVIKI